jgi:acyl-CoA thioesterase
MNLHTLLAQFTPGADTHPIDIPDNWLQGRTAYGGISSVLAYQAALCAADDLPPLQSAQIAFVGPLSGAVEVRASVLRRGRNTAFIESKISGESGIGLSCNFIFMTQRTSHLDFRAVPKPDFPPVPDESQVRSGPPEFFTQNMHYPDKRLTLGQGTPKIASWHRLIERDGIDPMAELLCIGDALPPSAMGLMTEKGMVSSMNWQVNMLTATPTTQDGWWYLESETHMAANGASSQYMTAWNSEGEAVMTGMQSVAIFA